MHSATDIPVLTVQSQEQPVETATHPVVGLYQDLLALAKVRLTAMVVVTTVVGYVTGADGHIHLGTLALASAGTWLIAGSAAALNQVFEIRPDGLMLRTRNRPLPAGRMLPSTAVIFALFTFVAGMAVLYCGTNQLTALLGLLNLILYIFIYTPLKRLSTINTLVGAICGAIPPIMGFTAAAGHIALPAVILGLLLFVWQIPHFLALAWMYRDDYAHGGFRMLSVVDTSGRVTCAMMILYSALLIPVAAAAWFFGFAGMWFGFSAILLGGAMVWLSAKMRRQKSRENARRVFLASVIYLPLILTLLMADLRHRPVGPQDVIIAAPNTGMAPAAITPAAPKPVPRTAR